MKWLYYIGLLSLGCAPSIKADVTGLDTSEDVECGHTVGEQPCNFTLKDQNGNNWSLYAQRGKIIVLDFSTMWCGICNNIATKGDEMVEDYGADNLIWVTILVEDATGDTIEQKDLQQWVTAHGITTPVLAGDRSFVDSTATTGYPITGWPTIIVIDENMILTHGFAGWSEIGLRAAIQKELTDN